MKYKYPALLALVAASSVQASDMVITGVIDGPLSGGVPKAVELFVVNDIADLSACGVGFANNGGGTDGQEFTFPATSASAGSYIYVASETTGFTSFFGFSPDYSTGSAGINGDDAIELFCNDSVIDVFGDINVDGSGEAWEYLDGWAYRTADTGPDGSTFDISNWSFSGRNALDGSSDNATTDSPFPLKNYAEEVDDGGDGGGDGDDPTAGDCVNCEDVTKIADADTFDASTYYDAVQTEIDNVSSNDVIKQVLAETITNGSVVLSYSQVWSALTITDEDSDDSDNIILWYTGTPRAKNLNGGNSGDWNREHSWPSSHGFGDSDGGFSAYTDIHHLRPSDVAVNSTRGNLDFDDSDTEISTAPGNYVDGDSFEPRDDIKGDVARMMFYMDTRYEDLAAFDDSDNTPDLVLVDDFTSTDSSELGRLCRLWEWHLEDPVDDAEMTRNDRIYEYQGNRNPFIDNPEWAEMFYLTDACDSDTDDGGDNGNDGSPATAGDLIISGVIDGPLSGGTPKAIEIFVVNDVSDLSTCGVGSANNGGGSDGQEFTFDPVAASKGDFIYVASEDSQFESFLGFAPDYTSGSAGINGDDAIELFCDGEVTDVFGDIDVDGSGEAWEYLDGWAYRNAITGPDGAAFNLDNWTFSGANALDGESENATAEVPFPIGTFYTEETLIISGVFDGPLSGGTPKTVEFYAVTDITDLSVFGFGSANNGGGSDGQEYTFAGSAAAGDYIYIASEDSQFEAFFGFAPNDTTGAAGINGDDAIELFKDGTVVDVFGDINTDGTGEAWDYLDGWAYRLAGTGADGESFVLANWTYSGTNVMDGESSNDTASTPFPIASYGGGSDDDGEVVLIGACYEDATLISAIQGSGESSPLAGQTVVVEAIVSAAFPALSGFFVQEETTDMDADSLTSEGLFVFYDGELPAEGSVVRVLGGISEFFDKTQMTSSEAPVVCGTDVASITSLSLPFASAEEAESLEGMLVSSAQALLVTNNFNLAQFGEVTLSSERLYNPTNIFTPGSDEAIALEESNGLDQVILDDGANGADPEEVIYPTGGLSAGNTLRMGDTVSSLTGVMDYSFSAYRVIPTQDPTFASTNARESEPELNLGNLKVASLNVLNYFTTLDEGSDICGPSASLGCRGANDATEFERQKAKTVAAIVAMDADIVGLMEIENNGFGEDSAIADLVSGINDVMGEGTYSIVDAGSTVGTDAITVALIYKSDAVSTVGELAILSSANSITDDDGALFDDSRNRPAWVQKFALVENGEELVVSVNHFKSKGSSCGTGDDDATTGQGNCNLTRTRAAQALTTFIATEFADTPALILGDLNSYAKEDPITAIETAGYTNLVNYFGGDDAYSYSFSGLLGYLDHALANNQALAKVVDVTEWHINADEPIALDYNTEDKTEAQIAGFYAADAYRMSDHDPVVIAMQLDAAATETETSADVNQDESVDFSDYFAILGMLGSATGDANFNPIADYDADGLISPLDLQAWYQLYLSQ